MFLQVVLFVLGFFCVTFVLHHFIYGRSPKSSSRPRSRPAAKAFFDSSSGDFAQETALHKCLVGVCFGDKAKAVRLVHYEMGRAPNITRIEAIKRALESLQEDRR